MTVAIIFIFLIGYSIIAFENSIGLNKAASAILTGVLCWTVYIMSSTDQLKVIEELMHHLGRISSILFFLLGAMTIVELIDSHNGFIFITDKIKTRSKVKLFWIISILTFFTSALLDNLTTAIVMTSLIGKLLTEKKDRLWFTGMIIIAANAGGAFSPLGDVTTTMLWIGGQITAKSIILQLFLPSLFACLIPILIICPRFRNQTFAFQNSIEASVNRREANFILLLSISLLLFVPIFKIATHLPPFMGILFALGILWVVVSIMHFNKPIDEKSKLSVTCALEKIDTPSILFFLGILLTVSSLESVGLLKEFAEFLNKILLGNMYLIGTTFGMISSIIDNVPLVAAAQGMYDLTIYPTDHYFWKFLALTTGTGGSAIIIGSAAGIGAMGIEKIDFMWYLRKIGWIATIGFIVGICAFFIQNQLLDKYHLF